MKKQKIFFVLMALWLSACGSSGYYILSVSPQPTTTYSHTQSIGITKLTVPEYLYKREIAIATSPNQISLLSGAVWGEDLDAGLTLRLIGFLQKKFQSPNIHAYPWGANSQPTLKVTVQITRFIAQGDHVYLDANWAVENLNTNKTKTKLFSTSVALASLDSSVIVAGMDSAFHQLEEDISRGIRK